MRIQVEVEDDFVKAAGVIVRVGAHGCHGDRIVAYLAVEDDGVAVEVAKMNLTCEYVLLATLKIKRHLLGHQDGGFGPNFLLLGRN